MSQATVLFPALRRERTPVSTIHSDPQPFGGDLSGQGYGWGVFCTAHFLPFQPSATVTTAAALLVT
jgi:hypothetical protein